MKYPDKKYRHLLFLLVALFLSGSSIAQFDIPEKPNKSKEQTSLYDYFELLSYQQVNDLEQKLIKYSDSTSTQIVIVIISSTKGEDISMLGARWGQKWGIGQADQDNGILILLAKDDREIDINTGYGIEYRITDRDAKQIIERIIIPEFKQSNYYEGLDKGTDAIFQSLMGEFKEDRDFSENDNWFSSFLIIFFIIIIIIIINKRKGGRGGNGGRGSGSLLDIIILSNMGRSGGYGGSSGSGSSGGGFGGGGFGGGGFGGGGASGGW